MSSHVKEVVCLTGNYPDGQKICAAEIVYDVPVAENVSKESFAVDGRNIVSVEVNGSSVMLHLDIHDRLAALLPGPEKPKKKPGEGKPDDRVHMGPPPKMPPAVLRPVEVTVKQVADIPAADGSTIPAMQETVRSSRSVQPIVEDFTQHEFEGMKYNLYTPKTADGEKYPLVVFIHDLGPNGDDPHLALAQGNGAVNFAKPEWQEKHPCYVLAPQIPGGLMLANDDFVCAPEINTILAMIDHVADTCAVDKDRIYTTGQSQGCMSSCEMNILRPELFAASLLVAGQWSPERMAEKCAGNRMWILVSQHDMKAYPGMTAVTDAMEKAGAKVGRYVWNAKSPKEELAAAVAEAEKDDVNVRFTAFEGSSVVPDGVDDNPGSNHVCTWPVVYEIEALKEWLFSCSK